MNRKPSVDKYPRPKFVNGTVHIERCHHCGSTADQTSNGCSTLWYWISCSRKGPSGCNAEGPKRRTARGAIAAWNIPSKR